MCILLSGTPYSPGKYDMYCEAVAGELTDAILCSLAGLTYTNGDCLLGHRLWIIAWGRVTSSRLCAIPKGIRKAAELLFFSCKTEFVLIPCGQPSVIRNTRHIQICVNVTPLSSATYPVRPGTLLMPVLEVSEARKRRKKKKTKEIKGMNSFQGEEG